MTTQIEVEEIRKKHEQLKRKREEKRKKNAEDKSHPLKISKHLDLRDEMNRAERSHRLGNGDVDISNQYSNSHKRHFHHSRSRSYPLPFHQQPHYRLVHDRDSLMPHEFGYTSSVLPYSPYPPTNHGRSPIHLVYITPGIMSNSMRMHDTHSPVDTKTGHSLSNKAVTGHGIPNSHYRGDSGSEERVQNDRLNLSSGGRVGKSYRRSYERGTRDKERELKNDYSQHFVDTGERPQNFIRDANMQDRFEEYPQLKELFKKKDELIAIRATPPFYLQADLRTFHLQDLGTLFDVVLIDPPWEEYYNRTAHVMTHTVTKPFWTYEELENLNIKEITASPSFVFLWVGSGGEALDLGRHLLSHWGFRRSEDIVWVKTNKENTRANINAEREKHSTFLRTKEHCLLGIKGSVRRNTDAHVIHANVDTDVIISEEPELGSLRKPEELYHIIEHFCLGRRRLELFGEDHNIRPGWVTIGNKISSSNWNSETYVSYFEGPNGNLLGTTVEIENVRPKSPNRDDSKLIYLNTSKKFANKGPPDRDFP